MSTSSVASRFTNKVAIVTGGAAGIGRAIAEALVAEGARVVATGRREAPLQDFARQHPEKVSYVVADVAESGSAKQVVDFAIDKFNRIDVLVNNAGLGMMKPLSMTTDEDLDMLFAINIKGLLAMTREATSHLSAAPDGAIVNISSALGQATMPNSAPYSATKAAGDRATKTLAAELGPLGIRVNTVAPGITDTEMLAQNITDEAVLQMLVGQTPLGRLGQPEDIAKAVLFLASEDASWITGQILQSTGGLLV